MSALVAITFEKISNRSLKKTNTNSRLNFLGSAMYRNKVDIARKILFRYWKSKFSYFTTYKIQRIRLNTYRAYKTQGIREKRT